MAVSNTWARVKPEHRLREELIRSGSKARYKDIFIVSDYRRGKKKPLILTCVPFETRRPFWRAYRSVRVSVYVTRAIRAIESLRPYTVPGSWRIKLNTRVLEKKKISSYIRYFRIFSIDIISFPKFPSDQRVPGPRVLSAYTSPDDNVPCRIPATCISDVELPNRNRNTELGPHCDRWNRIRTFCSRQPTTFLAFERSLEIPVKLRNAIYSAIYPFTISRCANDNCPSPRNY